jgi:type VI secretion system secreted protein VgrG
MTGLVPGISVIGTIHLGDAVAMQAHADAASAYAAAAGAPCTHILTGQDLGGMTLSPGVYCFASSAQLTGALTLDGMNDPNAAFIFQIGSTLTTATGAQVLLTNGATGDGTFFQVGSAATLGTNTAFAGNLAALASVTLTTGSTIHSGRALALNGTVALDSNDIDVSGLAIPVPEPAIWLSMMTGFGVAGIALRRRRSTPAAIARHALIGHP